MKTAAIWVAALALAGSAFAAATPPRTAPAAYASESLDQAVEDAEKAKGLTAAGPCDDATFLRRVSLDLVGTVPSAAEVETFLGDASPGKRAAKIEELLARPEFDRHFSALLSDFLLGKGQKKGLAVVAKTRSRDWFANALKERRGYDKIAHDLLTAEGPISENPAVAFELARETVPEDLTAATGKLFLGAQIQCAQCHDHPFEKWKQKDFYGLNAFWSRTKQLPVPEPAMELYHKGLRPPQIIALLYAGQGRPGGKGGPNGGRPGAGRGGGMLMRAMAARFGMGGGMGGDEEDGQPPPDRQEIMQIVERVRAQVAQYRQGAGGGQPPRPAIVVFDAAFGEAVIADPNAPPPTRKMELPKGEVVAPRFLDGQASPDPGPAARNRRKRLANWVTARENPYFAKAAANRFFAMLTGHGLVEPVDNIVSPAEGTLAPALAELATAFAASGYDLRWLCRLVTNSRLYQRGLEAPAGSEKDHALFTHASARQLTPDQLFASFLKSTGARELAGPRFEKFKDFILRQFVFTFDTDEGDEVDLFHETIPQALLLMNSRFINAPVQALRVPDRGQAGMVRVNTLVQIAAGAPEAKTRVDRLYLATLSRHADDAELENAVKYIEEHAAADPRPDRIQGQLPGMMTGGPKPPGGMMGGMADAANDAGDDEDHAVLLPANTPDPFRSAGERAAYEDVLWALVTSTEFIYNH